MAIKTKIKTISDLRYIIENRIAAFGETLKKDQTEEDFENCTKCSEDIVEIFRAFTEQKR